MFDLPKDVQLWLVTMGCNLNGEYGEGKGMRAGDIVTESRALAKKYGIETEHRAHCEANRYYSGCFSIDPFANDKF